MRLVLALVIVFGVIQLKRVAEVINKSPPAPPPPLDFSIIEERDQYVRRSSSRKAVLEEFGAPTHPNVWEPSFKQWEDSLIQTHWRETLPRGFWDKWVDPKDPNRWVALYFIDDKVYQKIRNGYQGVREPVPVEPAPTSDP